MSIIVTGVVIKQIISNNNKNNQNPHLNNIPTNSETILDNDDEKNIVEGTLNENIIESELVKVDKNLIKKIHGQLEDGTCWLHRAVDNSGIIVGMTQYNIYNQQDMILYNIDTEVITKIYTTEPTWSIGSIEINERYILWDETIPEETGLRPSRVMILDRSTNKVTKIFEDMNYSMYQPFIRLCLGKDDAYWSIGNIENGDICNCIMKYNILNDDIEEFKTMATAPAINDEFFLWIGPENDTLQNSAVFGENLLTGEVVQISKGKSPCYVVGNGKDVIFSGIDNINVSQSDDKTLYKSEPWSMCLYEDGEINKVYTSETDLIEFPQFNGKYIGWRGTDKLRMYSVVNNKTYILTEEFANYTEVTLGDNYAIWNSPVIEDAGMGKADAITRGMYDSFIYILDLRKIE